MKTHSIKFFLFTLLTIGTFLCSSVAFAQEASEQPSSTPEAVAVQTEPSQATLNSLRNILETISQHEQQIKSLQKDLKSQSAGGREEELRAEIQSYSERISNLEKNFDEISTGISKDLIYGKEDKAPVNLLDELKELLNPLLNEIKRLTSRPREMSQLRTRIENLNSKLSLVESALKNIDSIESKSESKRLKERLKDEREQWESTHQEILTQLSISKQKLEKRESEQQSIGESFEQLFQIFFKSRGRNLIVALLFTILTWFLCQRAWVYIKRSTPLSRYQEAFAARLFTVLYGIFTVMASALAFLIVLYFFGDWLLLTLAVLFIFGLVWTSRDAIPRFWAQGMLLLNMGAVREGERVIYNGLPWKVRSLNFYSQLENPRLRGGFIRLPIKDLEDLRSRPFSVEEPWFPTEEGDWVVLSDGTYAEVELQSIETVVLKLKGGSRRTLSSNDFAADKPENLSKGFRISTKFGIDYSHQAIVTNRALEIFHNLVVEGLQADGIMENEVNVNVEFAEAGASSLDVAVITDFAGKYDKDYQVLKRKIQRICVDICSQNEWNIPFNQMTVHMASAST